jgi:hypothetical protein
MSPRKYQQLKADLVSLSIEVGRVYFKDGSMFAGTTALMSKKRFGKLLGELGLVGNLTTEAKYAANYPSYDFPHY